jgi:hypothetical protein
MHIPILIENSRRIFADENKFRMTDFKMLASRRCNDKRTKTTAAYHFLKFFDAHTFNLLEPIFRVKAEDGVTY